MLTRNLLNRCGHRRTKKRGQAIIGSARRDCLNVLGESHAQHLVGLVENQHAHVRQVQRAFLNEVDDATRRADNDLRAALERTNLGAVGRAAVHGHNIKAGCARRKVLDRLGALHRKFTGGCQNESLHVALVGVNNRQQRQAERRGLTGAGLGDADDVTQLQQRRNGGGLNRRGNTEPHVGNGLADLLGQTEARKSDSVSFRLRRCLVACILVGAVNEVTILVCIKNIVTLVAGGFRVIL